MNTKQILEKADILNTLLSRKGQMVTVVTERPLKVRKGEELITKLSEFQARVGVNYDNIASVQEKRASGELPEVNAGLPWGEWDVPNYTIKHKDELYIRMATVTNGFKREPVYTRKGVEISAEEAKKAALASEFSPSNSEVFNIKLSNILEVR